MRACAIHCRCNFHHTVVAACAFFGGVDVAFGQLEFKGAELRGRIDRPGVENVWTLGDNNGNGTIDEDETFGTRIDVDDAFLDSPGYVYVGPEPPQLQQQGHQTTATSTKFGLQSPDVLLGFRDYGGTFTVDDDGVIRSVGIAVDYGDVYYIDTGPDTIVSNSFARFGGAQLMHVLSFEGDPEFTLTSTKETLEVGFGTRFLTGLQDYQFHTGGAFFSSDMSFDSSLQSQALGPQVSLRWTLRRGPWQARAEAAAALTYMSFEGDSTFRGGANVLPGAFNQSALLAPISADDHVDEWDFSPAIEAGLLASYDVTPTSLLFIRCDAIQFGNVRSLEQAIVWRLPDMGLRDPGGRDVTITAASIGVEVRR